MAAAQRFAGNRGHDEQREGCSCLNVDARDPPHPPHAGRPRLVKHEDGKPKKKFKNLKIDVGLFGLLVWNAAV